MENATTPEHDRDSLHTLSVAADAAVVALRRLTTVAALNLRLEVLRLGSDWHALEDRALHDLTMLHLVAQAVGTRMKTAHAKRGRKPWAPRDLLLYRVVELIRAAAPRTRAGDVRALASEVLMACRVAGTPVDDEALKKALPRGRRAARNMKALTTDVLGVYGLAGAPVRDEPTKKSQVRKPRAARNK